MYEGDHTHAFRRMALIGLWFLAVLVVAGLLVWLIFFHHDTKGRGVIKTGENNGSSHTQVTRPGQTSGSDQTQTSQSGQASTHTPAASPNPTTSTPPAATLGSTSPAATPAMTTPSELANTGTGDIVTPVVGAAFVGSAVYYVRLRRKLVS